MIVAADPAHYSEERARRYENRKPIANDGQGRGYAKTSEDQHGDGHRDAGNESGKQSGHQAFRSAHENDDPTVGEALMPSVRLFPERPPRDFLTLKCDS